MAVFVAVVLVAALVGGAVLYSKYHKKVDDAFAVVKDEVGEVKQAASDVKKDLSK